MSRSNLLFLITDQQQAATVAPGSPCLTPNLDALAARGTQFSRCYAPNPICSPARASLFTGLLPHSHGMVDVTHAVPPYRAELQPGLAMWPQMLQAAGYRTAYYGKWHVERSNRLEQFGFDDYDEDELYDLAADPHELRNLASDPGHRPTLEAMARRMWQWVIETGDDNMLKAQYGMFRFAPVGPEA